MPLLGTYLDRLPPLDAAADLLRELDRRGWRVVLVTSAQEAELDALRRAIDADDAITATASADEVEAGKPAPDPVHHGLALADVPAHGSVFVGDSVWDMRAAGRAQVTSVGLLCGGIPAPTSKRPGLGPCTGALRISSRDSTTARSPSRPPRSRVRGRQHDPGMMRE